MKKIRNKGRQAFVIFVLFLMTLGLVGTTQLISIESKRLDDHLQYFTDSKNERLAYVKERNELTYNTLLQINEAVVRKQMRLNLDSAYMMLNNAIEEDQKRYGDEIILDASYRKRLLTKIIGNMPKIYDQEGDMFVLNNKGQFEYDSSSDYDPPAWEDGTPYFKIPNRTRTTYDGIIWQFEANYVLYKLGIMEQLYDPSFEEYITKPLVFKKTYEIDESIGNKRVLTGSDVEYIKKQYPKVYEKLRDMGIVVQHNTILADKVFRTLSFQEDTNNENLYWYLNDKPYKEILEAVTQPMGSFGYNGEMRRINGSLSNPDFLKLTIVSGAQIGKYNERYESVQKMMDETYEHARKMNEKMIEKETKFINDQKRQYKGIMYSVSILGMLCLIMIAYYHGKASSRE